MTWTPRWVCCPCPSVCPAQGAPSHPGPSPPARAHLPNGAPRAEELVGGVGGHQGHGGERDAPAHPVGPQWEDVVIVGERLEADDADHHHKLGEQEGRRGRETGDGGAGVQDGRREGGGKETEAEKDQRDVRGREGGGSRAEDRVRKGRRERGGRIQEANVTKKRQRQ